MWCGTIRAVWAKVYSPFCWLYAKLGTESNYKVQVCTFNPTIPNNVFLVPGYNVLESLVPDIDRLSHNSVTLPTAYRNVYKVNDLKGALTRTLGDNTVFFIDTNPSFSSYTKMAIVSAERLIVPCFADIGSFLAIEDAAVGAGDCGDALDERLW